MSQADINKAILQEFADQFDPPLNVVGTQNIDNKRVSHGFVCAHWDDENEIGTTALCWGRGRFKAYLEVTGTQSTAADAGRLLAAALKTYGGN